ncbi:DUF3168 domain-containing protein [Thioclava sp. FR2]|uniref:DUF3168 domain-containing protein n=1 Tax=Thioclava sp. FR2 TaxID=3445780 RepID=UPI003EBF1034
MSYEVAAALQAAIYETLATDPELSGTNVFDAMPLAGATGTFILIGPEDVVDASDKSGRGAEHRLVVSVISDAAGFLAAKTIAARVSLALVDTAITLSVGRIVSINFMKAAAKRLDDGDLRRIDLQFRARVEV